jgi:hypothetical protein
MKDIIIKRIFLISFLLSISISLILILNYNTEMTNEILFLLKKEMSDNKYTVVVINKTESPIYFSSRFSFDLFSASIHNNEKIYHLTLSPTYSPNMFDKFVHSIYCDIQESIGGWKTKTSRARGDINYNNHNYKKNEFKISKDKNSEFCANIHFILYFTRQPHTISTYAEYVDVMKNNGYIAIGNFVENKLIFMIDGKEMQINDDAVTNPLNFVYK